MVFIFNKTRQITNIINNCLKTPPAKSKGRVMVMRGDLPTDKLNYVANKECCSSQMAPSIVLTIVAIQTDQKNTAIAAVSILLTDISHPFRFWQISIENLNIRLSTRVVLFWVLHVFSKSLFIQRKPL